MLSALALILLTQAAPEERYDHKGAVGLLVAASGGRYESSVGYWWNGSVDIGGTVSVGWRASELVLIGRLGFGGPIETQLFAGYRGYFGSERWKTLVDFDLASQFTPRFFLGGRAALGVQYEVAPVVGVYTQLGAQLGFGSAGILFKAELLVGVQLRSYLLE